MAIKKPNQEDELEDLKNQENTTTNSDAPFAGQPGANETTTGFSADTGYTGTTESEEMAKINAQEEAQNAEAETQAKAQEEAQKAQDEAERKIAEDWNAGKITADEVTQRKQALLNGEVYAPKTVATENGVSEDLTKKASFETNTETNQDNELEQASKELAKTTDKTQADELNNLKTAGEIYNYKKAKTTSAISSLESGGIMAVDQEQIKSIAQAMVAGNVSLNDGLKTLETLYKVPTAVKRAIYDEMGLTELERDYMTAPDALEQNYYNALYERSGLNEKKKQIDALEEEKNKLLAQVTDNPLLPAGVRQGRSKRITAEYDNMINRLTTEYNNGINSINDKVDKYMNNIPVKLEYLRKNAEEYFEGYEEDAMAELQARYLPEYLQASKEYKVLQAENDLADHYAKGENYNEITDYNLSEEQIQNLRENGAIVKEVGEGANRRVFINIKGVENLNGDWKKEITDAEIQSRTNALMNEDVTLTGEEARKMAISQLKAEHGITGDEQSYKISYGGNTGTSGTKTTGAGSIKPGTNVITLANGDTYNDRGYAADSTHTAQVNNIYNKLLNSKYTKDVQKINEYIKNSGKDTPFDAMDIAGIADDYGIDPLLLTALVSQESLLGTSNVAKKNNNFGGLSAPNGVVPAWLVEEFGATLGTPRPASEGGYYVKFKTVEDGLRAQAELLASRISKAEPKQEVEVEETTETPNVKETASITEESPFKGMRKDVYDRVMDISKDYENEQIIKDFAKIQSQYNKILSLSDDTMSATDDMALIYLYNKMLDPNSVVREGEYKTAQNNSQSMIKKFGKSVKNALDGTGTLSVDARKKIKQTVKGMYEQEVNAYNNVRDAKIKQINQIAGKDIGDKVLTQYRTAQNNDDIIEVNGVTYVNVEGKYYPIN